MTLASDNGFIGNFGVRLILCRMVSPREHGVSVLKLSLGCAAPYWSIPAILRALGAVALKPEILARASGVLGIAPKPCSGCRRM